MNNIAKLLIISGAALIFIGLFWQFGGKYLPLGRLPGDIAISRPNFKFFLPITSSIIISLILSIILWIILYLKR